MDSDDDQPLMRGSVAHPGRNSRVNEAVSASEDEAPAASFAGGGGDESVELPAAASSLQQTASPRAAQTGVRPGRGSPVEDMSADAHLRPSQTRVTHRTSWELEPTTSISPRPLSSRAESPLGESASLPTRRTSVPTVTAVVSPSAPSVATAFKAPSTGGADQPAPSKRPAPAAGSDSDDEGPVMMNKRRRGGTAATAATAAPTSAVGGIAPRPRYSPLQGFEGAASNLGVSGSGIPQRPVLGSSTSVSRRPGAPATVGGPIGVVRRSPQQRPIAAGMPPTGIPQRLPMAVLPIAVGSGAATGLGGIPKRPSAILRQQQRVQAAAAAAVAAQQHLTTTSVPARRNTGAASSSIKSSGASPKGGVSRAVSAVSKRTSAATGGTEKKLATAGAKQAPSSPILDSDEEPMFLPSEPEEEEDGEDFDGEEEEEEESSTRRPKGGRRQLGSTSSGGTPAARRRKRKSDSGDSDSEVGEAGPQVTQSSRQARDRRTQLIAQVLCRWWYVMPEWPPADFDITKELETRKLKLVSFDDWEQADDLDSEGCTKVYQITHFPGMVRNPKGEVIDLRPQEGKPCFTNLSKLSDRKLTEMLIEALAKQIEEIDYSPYMNTDDYQVTRLKESLQDELRKVQNSLARMSIHEG